ncbi:MULTISPECIES: adenylyl-sulfate kinase [Staphylococcus]|uniref:Adenylyl-sulfate kinase n=1 Tax=Staphylococcus pettenkoferi TaxID=170573 RepID=A0A2K4DUD1_9STAP|nr:MULTISPECIES: adenylyl-sulfate kinase [Staphylococcus]MBX8994125.1 adenylyl-sulfate kinase [Staphylococcus pettenkoferi]MCI2791454.1 adenylyl-sulfate kinase [Staphylococcus pettenkoferi]MCI2803659.1 adenylyl-sulfate kinase [Staphylococcus pettenkoferi]MCY1567155.1 adenylyl-sulfate kinase [Staphylococcus pettenkoferi]MCY1574397.1 adenylyl-sulfate kinase [Staphylococcus pettenkoferi]
MGESTNITWHDSEVTKQDRQQLHGHKSATLWFTGLSGSGKSTISVELEKALFERKKHAFRLDGDNVRHGLNKNLGFSPEDRQENIRRIGEVSKLMVDAGLITITAFISPYREDRDNVRAMLDDDEFIEIYTQCSVEECERRDPKGLYKKARTGEIPEFTGISAPYEEPRNPEITIDTEQLDVKDAVTQILNYLEEHQYI